MAESEDASDLKSEAARHPGSTPGFPTTTALAQLLVLLRDAAERQDLLAAGGVVEVHATE